MKESAGDILADPSRILPLVEGLGLTPADFAKLLAREIAILAADELEGRASALVPIPLKSAEAMTGDSRHHLLKGPHYRPREGHAYLTLHQVTQHQKSILQTPQSTRVS